MYVWFLGMQHTNTLSERMTTLEQQNRLILQHLQFLGNNASLDNFRTPLLPPAGDIYTPPTSVDFMQSRPTSMPLPTSTPSRISRLPLSTLLTPSTPNSEVNDSAPTTPSTSELPSFTSGQSPSSATAVNVLSSGSNSTLTILSTSPAKENKPPPIPYAELINPQTVVEKYPKLLKQSRISTLAVRLAKESYFGGKVMASCTVRGVGDLPGLPKTELDQMKAFLQKLTLPRFVSSRVEFENLWRSCIESINQSCKAIRKALKEGKTPF